MNECLVLFSGGKDSLLSTILLIEQGYKVKLVHYDNMCTIGCNNVKNGYKRLVKKYGSDKIEYIGTKNITCFFRNFINIIYNKATYFKGKKFNLNNVKLNQTNVPRQNKVIKIHRKYFVGIHNLDQQTFLGILLI